MLLSVNTDLGFSLEKNLSVHIAYTCYESKLKELSNETTLVLSNIRELDRVPNTK